jgi:hypothetical protein
MQRARYSQTNLTRRGVTKRQVTNRVTRDFVCDSHSLCYSVGLWPDSAAQFPFNLDEWVFSCPCQHSGFLPSSLQTLPFCTSPCDHEQDIDLEVFCQEYFSLAAASQSSCGMSLAMARALHALSLLLAGMFWKEFSLNKPWTPNFNVFSVRRGFGTKHARLT